MSSPQSTLKIPAGLQDRVNRYVRRRLLLRATAGLLLVIASTVLILVGGAALDHLLMLPAAVRGFWLLACLAPTIIGLLGLLHLVMNSPVSESDLRLLDNEHDDMRAAMNLADRIADADPTVNRDLAERSASSAEAVAAAPLPPAHAETRLIRRRLALTVVALLLLAGFRIAAPDLHTVVRRADYRHVDFGTVGARKFQFAAEVWTNPAAAPDLDPDHAEGEARAIQHFQRETLTADGWEKHGNLVGDLADDIAGYNPLAMTRDTLRVLAGDKVILHFNAVDDRSSTTTDGLEFLRLEDGRSIPLQYSVVAGSGMLTVPRLQESQRFVLRAGSARSPVYTLQVAPRPSPIWLRLYHTPPAHYGKDTQMTVIRDRAAGIDGNRLSGLPGAKLAIEFETPYGDDLDLSESYALVGNRRLSLRRLTSRDPKLKAEGVQAWTVDFNLDDAIVAEPRLFLHLVTAKARFGVEPQDGDLAEYIEVEPITNRYDDPLLVQVVDDQPPTVEITMLPTQTHFEKDAAFAFRYRYTDDHGIAEVGLEIQASPTSPSTSYVPLDIRPTETPGTVRSHDELMHIIDLKSVRGNYLAFCVVVKDLKGQETKSSSVSIGMTRHFTEDLLPKLTGGWYWAWPHNPNSPMKRDGDLETPDWLKGEANYVAVLTRLIAAFDGKQGIGQQECGNFANRLDYHHVPYLDSQDFECQPFAFHHRDYPYWFRRQGSTYLTGMAEMDGHDRLEAARAALLEMATSKTPMETPAYQQLVAQRPIIESQLAIHQKLTSLHDEIALRAALMRSAYLCDVIVRDLAVTRQEFARLQEAAGPAPADLPTDDPWRGYLSWVDRDSTDFDLQQQARLVRLQIRNLNSRMKSLNDDLQTILSLGGDGLDPRFQAVVGMVQRFGTSIYSIDRAALELRLQLLTRFVRDGILVSETAVYAAVDSQYPANAQIATDALALVPAVTEYETQLTAVLEAARAISYAQLHRSIGEPTYPADASLKWRRNQESQLRSQLELLNRQASAVLYAEPFLSCEDLEATTRSAQEMLETLKSLDAWLQDWPGLAKNHDLLRSTATALTTYGTVTRRVIDLQRRAGMLADFAPIFAEGSPHAELGVAMVALGQATGFGSTTRQRLIAIAKLEQTRPVALETDAQKAKAAEVDAAIAERVAARDAAVTALTTHLQTLADGFTALAKAQGDATATPAAPASSTPPNPLIAGVTPTLFDYYRPDTTLYRLIADLDAHKQQPQVADGIFAQAVRYHSHYATDAGLDILASPLAEYLRARIALGLIAADPRTMGDFSRTYTEDGKVRVQAIYDHLTTKDEPQVSERMKAWIAAQSYAQPALPEPLAAVAAPYLDAQRKGQLPAYLSSVRAQRLAELKTLADKLGPHLDASEAMLRCRSLAEESDSLLEDIRLYHLEAGDIRVADRWARLAEQAEGLDRDLRSGRLTTITPTEREAFRQNVAVFRSAGVADVVSSPAKLAQLRAYRDAAGAVADRLRPTVLEAARIATEDAANLKRDLSILAVSSRHVSTWYRRKLQAELHDLENKMAGIAPSLRIKARVSFRSSGDARLLQADANLASFAWRSLLILESGRYALSPTKEATAAQLDDLATMLAYKALPEFYYDGFTGRIARRRYAAFNSPDAMVSQLLENLDKGENAATYVVSRHQSTAPAVPPSLNADLQIVLNDLGVFQIIFQLEKDLNAFSELQSWTYGDDASRRRAAAKIRQSYRSQGAFWRDMATPLADYLEAGAPLLASIGKDVDPAVTKAALDQQAAALDRVFRYLDRVGTGLGETELAELAPVIEAQTYTLDWLAALQKRTPNDYHTGYADMHNTVVSYIKSIHGSLYPEPVEYQPRTRYKHALHNFGSFDFETEILDMEVLSFRRSDEAQADVYRALLRQADRALQGQAIDPGVTAIAWNRFTDSKFRYLMAYSSPEPGGGTPPPGFRTFDKSLPRHLGQAFSNALGIDLPTQDNVAVRQLYFDAIQETRERSEGQTP